MDEDHRSRNRGERNGAAKLSPRDVRAIRLLRKRELYTPAELARLYGCSRATIQKIVARTVWAHVK